MNIDIFLFIKMLGGLAIFLFGMNTLSTNLEKITSGRVERILQSLTDNIFKAVLLGAVVTALIQSSAATTVVVVGLVNSGVIKLRQSIGVIMGANIGTTITAQIIRMSDLGSDNMVLQLLKPINIGSIALIIGIIIVMSSKDGFKKSLGLILSGFGLIFTGMNAMEVALSPLAQSEVFTRMFATLSNPVLGILAGAFVTAALQSSSVSVGILQALSTTGVVTHATAFPIIMGQNIGTCFTSLLSSIGAKKNAKRAAMVHLYFNLIGTALFVIVFYSIQYSIGLPFWNDPITRGGIADFHTIFNIVCTLAFMPFASLLEKLACATIRSVPAEEGEEIVILEDRLLESPSLAIQRAKSGVMKMAVLAKQNFEESIKMLRGLDPKTAERIRENEESIDKMEGMMGHYLLKLSDKDMTGPENGAVSELMRLVNEFERIGDYSINVLERAEEMSDKKIIFSDRAYDELETITQAIDEVIALTNSAFEKNSMEDAIKVEPLEETIDIMKDTLKDRHIQRLRDGKCNIDAGIIFLEILTNLERISDHCSNIAVYLIGNMGNTGHLDAHSYLRNMHAGAELAYNNELEQFEEKYLKKI